MAIVGAGFVGATAAYALLIKGVASDIVLVDLKREKAQGEALDLEHGMQFVSGSTITYGDSYDLCKDADVVVVTAGVAQKPGETRLQLVKKNAAIFQEIIPRIATCAPHATLIIVTNPVDVLTYLALKYSGFPRERVFGTGTTLDTARLRYHIGEFFGVSAQSVHAYILGEHGDSEFPVWSLATVGGLRITDVEGYSASGLDMCFRKTKRAAYEIISAKGATYYAIGLVIADLCRAVLNDERKIYPLSVLLDNYYDKGDLCMSVPCVLGRGGIHRRMQLPLNREEQEKLHASAGIVREALRTVT